MSENLNGFGTLPTKGEPLHGPTLLSTWWVCHAIGNVPKAIPLDGWFTPKVDADSRKFQPGKNWVTCMQTGKEPEEPGSPG